ncbi:MAG: insulinase family protein [Oscillospiraceae bacterium]|nr:insulinase family protein [Oscillospiraceae bacterium]
MVMFRQTGDSFLGFTATRIRSSEELGGRVVELIYEKTATPVCWVDNGQENKLFSIAFRTLPSDSTGVFHILEHSVLCGSAKYPVREPFVELLKSSMNTFLNAMTFPDKTMYPISSRNTRDFLNLTGVYLDAVFAPRILTDPNIFYQEGWHIEQDEDGSLSYKGVVFNEMKGAMSGADRIAEQKLIEMLFPDTCYGYNSGGDPAVIPSLTYEQFCETYRRCYHPSNALIFLDGAVPLEETLTMIAEYLSQYTRSTDLPQFAVQQPVSARASVPYELDRNEPLTDKCYLSVGRIAGDWRDITRLTAIAVLNTVLAGTNDAPLKRPVLSAGLAQEMTVSIDPSIAQPYLSIDLKNIRDGSADEILALIRRTAAELADRGLDREALEAAADILEFQMMEPSEPQGLDRCINAMNTWLYGGDPLDSLEYGKAFAGVRKMIADGEMEALLRELYAGDGETAVLLLEPSHSFGDAQRADEAARLKAISDAWTDADRAENAAMNARLLKWQQTPDTPEQLAALPQLPLSEVSEDPPHIGTETRTEQGVTVLFHKLPCREIEHITLYFRLTDAGAEELPQLGFLTGLFTELPTAHYDALELRKALDSTVGRMNFSIGHTRRMDDRGRVTPYLAVSYSVLREKREKAQALLLEIMQHTDFTQKENVRERLMQSIERRKQMKIAYGHALAVTTAMSRYSAADAMGELLSGETAGVRMNRFAAEFDAAYADFAALAQRVAEKTFCRRRLIAASVTAAEDVPLDALLSALPEGTDAPAQTAYAVSLPERAGSVIPAQIGFAAQCWNMQEAGMPFTGSLRVGAKILSLSYLWNQVRVQGGAYGTGLRVGRDGSVSTYSFRDPTPAASLDANAGLSGYIRSFCESGEPLTGYIISTVSDMEPLRSPREDGAYADMLWMNGLTEEMLRQTRHEALTADRRQLLADCAVWDAFAAQGAVCIVAAENQLADAPGLTRIP